MTRGSWYQWLGVACMAFAFVFVVLPISLMVSSAYQGAGVPVMLAGLGGLWYTNRRFGFVGS